MILFDDLRDTLAETLRSRVLVVFGRAVDRVDVDIEEDVTRGDLSVAPAILPASPDPKSASERLIHGMHLPQLIRSASVESDGTIEFHLDRGAVIVALIGREGFDALLLQRIPDDLWRSARAYAEGNITTGELLQSIAASSKRR
jgi:hypothetical protein